MCQGNSLSTLGGSVVESRFLENLSDVKYLRAEFQDFIEIWNSKHRDDGLPRRPDIDPSDLKPFLGRIMVIEIVRSDSMMPRFKYRLFGSAIAELQHSDLTGRYVDEILQIDEYARVSQVYMTMMSKHRPHFLTDRAPLGREIIVYERVMCPLRGKLGDEVDFLIGLYSYEK